MKRALKIIGLLFLVVFAAIQFIPVSRTNPPVTREIHWNTLATHALAQRACLDCHSNTTQWPWYSHIAPPSILVAGHVEQGRRVMNFSEWDKPQRVTFAAVEDMVTRREMPIRNYVLAHPEAKLSQAEVTQLVDGLRATFLQDPPIPRSR